MATRPSPTCARSRLVPCRTCLVGGRSFHDREEVVAIRTALDAIEWPADELAVYATLRGPLLAINDEELLSFRSEVFHLNPLRKPSSAHAERYPDVAEALSLLRSLHVTRNRRPIADTIEQLLAVTRATLAFDVA